MQNKAFRNERAGRLPVPVEEGVEAVRHLGHGDFALEDVADVDMRAVGILVDLVLHFDRASAEGGSAEEAARVAIDEHVALREIAGRLAFHAGIGAGGAGGGGVPLHLAFTDKLPDGPFRIEHDDVADAGEAELRAEAGAADVERGGRAQDFAIMPDDDNAFAALAADADAALEDGADGDALGVGENLRRDGIIGTLPLCSIIFVAS